MPAAHGFELHAVRAHRNDGQRFRAVPRHFRSAGSHGSPEECPASGRARGRFRAGVLRHPHGGCGVFLRRDAPPRRDQSCDPAGDDHRDRRAFRQRQDDPVQPDRPVLGCAGGQGAVRRARRAGIHLRRPAAQHQHGVSERIPV